MVCFHLTVETTENGAIFMHYWRWVRKNIRDIAWKDFSRRRKLRTVCNFVSVGNFVPQHSAKRREKLCCRSFARWLHRIKRIDSVNVFILRVTIYFLGLFCTFLHKVEKRRGYIVPMRLLLRQWTLKLVFGEFSRFYLWHNSDDLIGHLRLWCKKQVEKGWKEYFF